MALEAPCIFVTIHKLVIGKSAIQFVELVQKHNIVRNHVHYICIIASAAYSFDRWRESRPIPSQSFWLACHFYRRLVRRWKLHFDLTRMTWNSLYSSAIFIRDNFAVLVSSYKILTSPQHMTLSRAHTHTHKRQRVRRTMLTSNSNWCPDHLWALLQV